MAVDFVDSSTVKLVDKSDLNISSVGEVSYTIHFGSKKHPKFG